MGDDEAFKVWLSGQPTGKGQMGRKGVTLKLGQRTCKVAMLSKYGDVETGRVSKEELQFKTVPKSPDSPGYDFDNPTAQWACEDEQISRLIAFLTEEVERTGRYRLVDVDSPASVLAQVLDGTNGDAKAFLSQILDREDGMRALKELLSVEGAGISLAQAAVLARRRALVTELQELVLRDDANETKVQALMGEAYWLFGGSHVGVAERRNLTVLDEHDIPLLGADGTLHIVELKGPVIPALVKRHRNHRMVGAAVHEAVSQSISYLRSLDEQGANLTTLYRNEFGEEYDMQRVFATVVIGHPAHVSGVTEQSIDQTLRSYNAHLSRVQVLTYKNLLDAAERALAFEETALSEDSR